MLTFMARYTETVYPVKKLVPLSADMAEAISEYRHRERLPSENEAIRRLIEAGLKAGDKIPIRKTSAAPSGGDDMAEKSSVASQPTRRPRIPKTAPLSKEAQLRALREQGAR
jgi:hypothetical protein